MAFCAKCGGQLADGAAFCPKCGAAVAQAGAGGTAAAPAPTANAGMQDNVAAALAYIWIVGLIFLFVEPFNKKRFVRFHAFQSVFFGVAWMVLWFGLHIIFGIVLDTVGFFGLLALPLYGLISLGGFILWLFLVFKAYNNEEFKLPFIGELAAKQAGN